ncbi:pyruvate kinase [Myxococcota bacterium]|nr:pyruvate kinase [Myxococcota bacterium]
MRRTRIVCTLGPASRTPETLDALLAAGLDCARLNFSHGDHAAHAALCAEVRAAARRAGRPVAVLADLSGPKMRIGRFAAGPITLEPGATFTFTTRDEPGTAERVSITYEPLPRDVVPGDVVLLDDGRLRLRVEATTATDVRCVVEIGGPLSDRKGLNLPGAALSAPALSDKDRADVTFAVGTLGVDFVALSFVRSAADVFEAKALAGATPVIAKIEKPEAIERLTEILDAADGAMVARGDLGVELGAEKVPLLQKRIIREVNRRGKIVITATQMLDSMVATPRPTRAEVSDVANAVLDGTDAVMLSNETASGQYPVEAVAMMDAIAREVEAGVPLPEVPGLDGAWRLSNAAARAAAVLSTSMHLSAIVSFTRDGASAERLSEYRPACPVLALAPTEAVAQRLALHWGLVPRVVPRPADPDPAALSALAVAQARALGLAPPGSVIAVIAAVPAGGDANTVQLVKVEG